MTTVARLAGALTHPVDSARSFGGATIDASLGAIAAGLLRGGHLRMWVVEHAGGPAPRQSAAPWATGPRRGSGPPDERRDLTA